MKILGLHHVAIAVDDIEKYSMIFENLFGIRSGPVSVSEKNGISLSFLNVENSELEFIRPLTEDSSISKFLKKRGPGIHHFCLMVDDVEGAVAELKSRNIRMIDNEPRPGAEGSMIAFIHPDSAGGILIELKEERKKER